MTRLPTEKLSRAIVAAMLLALCAPLASCSSFDPADLLDFLDTKKKLPGERRAVFPEGVPGIEKGVPPELYKGAQQQQDVPPPVVAEPAPETKGKKGRSKSAARSAPQTPSPELDSAAPDEGANAETPPAPKMKQKRTRATSIPRDEQPPPPEPAPRQPPPQQSATPFPAPMPSGGFSR